jgi:antirestriction protein
MERTPQPPGGEAPQLVEAPAEQVTVTAVPETREPWDERVISEGIEAALAQERAIDNHTARYIAGQLHGGQDSALYALASSGAITDSVMGELVEERAVQPPAIQEWIDSLIAYCAGRPDPGPVEGWVEQAEAQDRLDLMARIAADSVTTLGGIATVEASEALDQAEVPERDVFSWGDAAQWSPEDTPEAEIGQLTDEQLDALFETDPDEEVGDVAELGWYALIQPDDRPGGYVMTLNDQGTRQVLEVTTDGALAEAWSNVTRNYQQYYAEREAYEVATGEVGNAPSGVEPQIWVGSLADYNVGFLHGEWFDATREAEELELATRFMLRGSHTSNAEEWAVMDYSGFGSLHLGEYVSFETISRIANGIGEHGDAFAAWADHVGSESTDALDRFADHYRGEWQSFEGYIKDYLEESEFYRFLEYVPEDMRGYVEVDIEQIARDWVCDYEVIERPDGGVWVFDPRA